MVIRFKCWFYSKKKLFFLAFKLTKNVDPNKYSYSGYSIVFGSCALFSYPGFDLCKNAVIFGVGNSSSVHIYNNKKTS